MKAKYNSTADILKGKRQGFSFQSSAKGETVQSKAGNLRPRYQGNINRIYALSRASSAWSALPSADKALWNQFAIDYPEPTRLNSDININGQGLFIRRQVFEMTRLGMNCPFFEPTWEEPDSANTQTLRIIERDSRIFIDLYFPAGYTDWINNIFVTQPFSAGQYVARKRWVFMGFIFPGVGELDVTDQYIAQWGKLPGSGQCFFVRVDSANICNPRMFLNRNLLSVHQANRWFGE